MRLTSLPASLLALALVVAPAPGQALSAADDTDCAAYGIDDPVGQTDSASLPLGLLGVEQAHALFDREGLVPGAGVRVAVLDSGITPRSGVLDVIPGARFSQKAELVDYHGSAVAGLIAGDPRPDGQPIGIAPGAEIVDVRVYDQNTPTDPSEDGVETALVTEGLRWVADNAETLGIGVVNLSLAVTADKGLAQAVADVRRQDVVIVAASGNRPQEDTDPLYVEYGAPVSGEDAVRAIFPAGYLDDVVAVNATSGGYVVDGDPVDVRESVLQNTATDVAVPTYGGVSLAVNGSTCVLPEVATSWAAAEVSGVVALLRSRYPDENSAQIVARLKATADGTVEDPTALTGAGVVQPVEALSRPLSPDESGAISRSAEEDSQIPKATAPDPAGDPLALVRERAVWWGLLGGAGLVLALLLRPILARRND